MNEPDGRLGVGDRFKAGPSATMVAAAFAQEAGDGQLLYHVMSQADLAHAIMLTETNIIPTTAGQALLTALLEMDQLAADAVVFDPAQGDAYSNRMAMLRQRAPDAAGWLQAGRPRREVTTLGFLLLVRDRLLTLHGVLLDLMSALLAQAKAHLTSIMPDYTYLQAAHPTTLAHYLLTFVQPITRDLERLQLAFSHADKSPAGGGSTNGSRLPLDRERLAALLGFSGVLPHTRDGMWQPDLPVELLSATVTLLINGDRLAEDLQIWATAEFGFVTLADAHSRISVIMPQKKNPYSLAYFRGVARESIGRLTSAITQQMTPSGQVDNRIFAYGSVPRTLQEATNGVALLADVVQHATFNEARMATRAGEGFTGATDLVDVMMQEQVIDTRLAHRIVGQAVRLTLTKERPFNAALLNEVAQNVGGRPFAMSDEKIETTMNPQNIIETRTGMGGASARSVQEMIAQFAQVHAEAIAWQNAHQTRIKSAKATLIEQAKTLCLST